jgi:hypothetical protein
MFYFLSCNIVNTFKRNYETFVIVLMPVVSAAPVRILPRQHLNDLKLMVVILIMWMEINLIMKY